MRKAAKTGKNGVSGTRKDEATDAGKKRVLKNKQTINQYQRERCQVNEEMKRCCFETLDVTRDEATRSVEAWTEMGMVDDKQEVDFGVASMGRT